MHDSATVIFSTGSIVLYHVDPETDGTDDSCGYGRAKLPKELREKLKRAFKYDVDCVVDIMKLWDDKNRLEIVYNAYSSAKWNLYRKRLDASDYFEIMDLALNSWNNLKVFNDMADIKEEAMHFYLNVARLIYSGNRPWWKHPKYHFWHWSLQIGKVKIGRKLKDAYIEY